MEAENVDLLPLVCTVLADPKKALPDDTCLEKLLDWLTQLTRKATGHTFLELNPCLIDFISSVCKSKSMEPRILSFTLKLAGLLAGNEQDFCVLKRQNILKNAFECQGWIISSHWGDATVRSGWIRGLQYMLQHWQAMFFLLENGLIKEILHLQLDKSLFVASAANQLLGKILALPRPSASMDGDGAEHIVDCGSPRPSECADGIAEIVKHVEDSLMSGIPFNTHQSLKLVSLSLSQCQPHVREVLWQKTEEAIGALVENDHSSLTQPFLEVLLVAARTPLFRKNSSSIVTLMEALLSTLNPTLIIPFASGIIHLENCPQSLKKRAIGIILQPLEHFTAFAGQQQQDSDLVKEFNSQPLGLEEQLSQKAPCLTVLCLSLSSMTELSDVDSFCQDDSMQSVIFSVMTVLKICAGFSFSSSAPAGNYRKLIGCTKLQKCALDTLAILSHWHGNSVLLREVLTLLVQYLQNPDSDPSVFKKALQATLKWLCRCSETTAGDLFLSQDLFLLLKKRLCDMRWEVRDSSLEFLTQLTSNFQENPGYCEKLSSSGVPDFLVTLLTDPESYVRASAIFALGHIVTSKEGIPTSGPSVQELSKLLVDILAQDTEGFARRSVIKVFVMWLRNPSWYQAEELEKSVIMVLQLGSNDLDWEVKVHTLELVQTLIDQTLGSSCPYAVIPDTQSKGVDIKESLSKLHHLKVFSVLFSGLFDCDRPVAQKACEILLFLKGIITENCDVIDDPVIFDLLKHRWSEDILQRFLEKHAAGKNSLTQISLMEILTTLNLEDMHQTLGQSSDHLENSPRSLMEDILASAHTSEDNIVDCY